MARFLQGIFGNRGQTDPPASVLRVQTSLQGVPIPIMLGGQMRVAGNLIWYGDFISTNASQSGQGGKGGVSSLFSSSKGNQGQYNYSASFIIAVCEGGFQGLVGNPNDNSWESGSPSSIVDNYGLFVVGDYEPQGPWGYLEAYHPDQALFYRGIAYFAFANVPLGSSPSTPQLTFELLHPNNNAIYGTPDGDLADAFFNFLTNPYFGCGFQNSQIGSLNRWRGYLLAFGLVGSPIIDSPTTGAAFLNNLLTATASNARWSNGLLDVVPYGDQPTVNGAVGPTTENYIVPIPSVVTGEPIPNPQITVAYPGLYVADLGVVYTNTGAPLAYTSVVPPLFGQYTFQGAGTYMFSLQDEAASVSITYEKASSGAYNPVVDPVWDFTTDDFLKNQGTIGQVNMGDSPLICVRKPRDQMITTLKLEYLDRNTDYNPVDIEVKDEASITAFGRERPSDIQQCHFFCTAGAAQASASLQLGRQQIARTFQWTCGRNFILLDIMDVVTVTDPGQGLYLQGVRLVEIQENADGALTMTGEEFLGTLGHVLYGTQPSSGYGKNYNVDPGAINPPILFEPTDELAGGLVVWGAVSGAKVGIWGGCFVWASYDDINYAKIGVVTGPARMGKLTAALPAVSANPTGQTIDDANTCSVDLTESGGALLSGSAADELSLNTKCYVGGEIVAYRTATLTATHKYGLTHLARGGFGTEAEIVLHPAGTPFARLDDAIFEFSFDAGRIGATVYLKFQSFNFTQGGLQELSAVSAWPYTLTGAALGSPMPNVQNFTSLFWVDDTMNLSWDPVTDFRPVMYEIRKGVTWATGLFLGRVAHPPFAVHGDDTYWIAAASTPAPGLTVYSETPSDLSIVGSLVASNTLVAWDEQATGWTGAFTNNVGISGSVISTGAGGGPSVYSAPDAYSAPDVYSLNQSGTYEIPVAHEIDAGRVVSAAFSITWAGHAVPVAQNILTMADFLNQPDILAQGGTAAGSVDIYPQISFASNDPTDIYAAGDVYGGGVPDVYGKTWSWSPWQKFAPGSYVGRGFKLRMVLDTFDPYVVAVLNKFAFSVSVPNRIDHVLGLAVAAIGTPIVFAPDGAASPAPFNSGPGTAALPTIGVTILNAQTGDYVASYSGSLTLAGFTLQIKNSSNVGVARTCNVEIEGW